MEKKLIKAFVAVIFERAVTDISVGASFLMLLAMIYVSIVYDSNLGLLCVFADIIFLLLAYFADRAAEEDEKRFNELYARWEKERRVRNGRKIV